MNRWLILLLSLTTVPHLPAKDETKPSTDQATAEVEEALPVVPVAVELKDKVWFTDRAATAVLYFDEAVKAPEVGTSSNHDISFLEFSTQETANPKTGKFAAVIRYLPRKVGTVRLPTVIFTSETTAYHTQPKELTVSEPQRTDAMSLTLTTAKQRIYVGEPVKFNLVWDCRINAAELEALKLYPEFFNDSNIEVIIPRNTADEKTHVGIPIGGRRVIGTRTREEGDNKSLGRIELPIYLRFSEAGTYTLPETRLECAQLAKAGSDFARYAAHFNNALFESVDAGENYVRIFTTAASIQLEVLPLPANESGTEFSGLYAPIDFEVSLKPSEIEIGQLMELDIKVSGNTPHGMIELPKLSHQSGLRKRFLVDNDLSKIWHEDGTLFRTRLRALSTTVQAFPSLQFLVFNPKTGDYEKYSTQAIPLKTLPSNGQNFIPLKSYKGAAVTLTNQPEGIWHNLKANRMNDLLNILFDLFSSNFWLFILLGPIAFIALLPVVRERHRRAKDRRYRERAQAYEHFKRTDTNSPEKWPAFLAFMAAHFGHSSKAWTTSDSVEALNRIQAPDDEIEQVIAMHRAVDAREFGESQSSPEFTSLNSIAKRVLKSTSHSLLMLLLACQLFTSEASATEEWSQAEQLFTQAQNELAGSEAANALYIQAALKFQAEAKAGKHTGESWGNAGNAWFQAGSLGNAIAAYRIAQSYRPFGTKLAENLAAARAMTLNDIPIKQKWWQQLPIRWLKSAAVLISLLFWTCLLITLRYQNRKLYILTTITAICLLIVSIYLIQKTKSKVIAGVVIVDALYSKKGPDYAYSNAFNEPLHDGSEFIVLETRNDWSFVELNDGRRCWLKKNQITTFEW